jgi:Tol biopolymer transport system component
MRATQLTRRLSLAILLPAICCWGRAAPAAPPPADLVASISTLIEGAGRVDWNKRTGLIAYDIADADGVYGIEIVNADGSGRQAVTLGHEDASRRHIGQPAWHPSGEYLAFQAEKQVHATVRLKWLFEPGVGIFNDLWLLELATGRVFPLRVMPGQGDSALLHPHFSPDGRQLSWGEMYERGSIDRTKGLLGLWRLMVADFAFGAAGPRLSNIRALEPGGPAFYENHGFSPRGRSLLFTSNLDKEGWLDADIYTLDLRTDKLTRLTEGGGWNEHAHFSPNGRRIIWMRKNRGILGRGTDYWIMKSDGTAKRRLTYFNQRGHPHYNGETVVVADFAWSRSGASIAAFHRTGAGIERAFSPKKMILIRLDMEKIRQSESGVE